MMSKMFYKEILDVLHLYHMLKLEQKTKYDYCVNVLILESMTRPRSRNRSLFCVPLSSVHIYVIAYVTLFQTYTRKSPDVYHHENTLI